MAAPPDRTAPANRAAPAGRTAPEEHASQPASLALYRKYRPATFAEVRGQEHVTAPLRQALKSGRVNHAYLFSGPRGCGKTSSARILARSLNCVNGPTPDPCGVCDSCVALAPSGPGSIDVIEIDAASHGGVDDARDLRERAFYSPVSGRYKVYIIDEAHMVTSQGFNALLKLVEEPPPHLKFIFATTEPEKVIPTIRSRTHHYPFRLMPPSVMRELAEEILRSENVPFEPAVLPLVVRAGGGSARDTLSILDQLLAGSDESGIRYDRAVALLGYTDASLIDEIVDSFAAADGAAVFRAVNRVIEGGHEPRRFAMDLLDRFRDLIVLSSVPDAISSGLLEVPPDRVEVMTAQATRSGLAQLTRAAEIISTGLDQMRGATSPRLLLELMCAQVLLPGAATDERSVLARLERLEAGGLVQLRGAAQPPAAPPAHAAPQPTAPSAPPEAAPAPQAPASPQPASPQPAAAQPPSSGSPAPQPATAQPAQPAPRGTVTTDVIQQGWDGVLQALMAKRRVAWIVVRTATPVSLEENVLTLRFPNAGHVKGFMSSGYDGLLKEVLHARFGVNVVIRAMASGDPGPGAPGTSGAPGTPGTSGMPGTSGAPGTPATRRGAPEQAASAQPQPARPQSAQPAQGWPQAAQPPAPSPAQPPATGSPPAQAPPVQFAPVTQQAAPSPAGQSPDGRAAVTSAVATPVLGQSGPSGHVGTSNHVPFGDDVPFPNDDDDPYAIDEDEIAGSVDIDAGSELTGISLIQRDLGAKIIAEYEE